jgi:hypothetical protein
LAVGAVGVLAEVRRAVARWGLACLIVRAGAAIHGLPAVVGDVAALAT